MKNFYLKPEFFNTIKKYSANQFVKDLVAGIIVAIIALPYEGRHTMSRLIFHIDVNSAFLSWEATRRVSLGEDDIRLVPSAIGGDREKRTGVILAKSIPAKKFGIKTGEPVASALRKCPDLFLARPDFKL